MPVEIDQIPDPEEAPADLPAQPDGLFVAVQYGEDGSVAVEVNRLGSVRVTEQVTILEQALRSTRNSLGLPG